MAFSTFVFDTIDVATRLGRYIVQELFGWKARGAAVLATAATLLAPALVLVALPSPAGAPPPYMRFWSLFGTANQLLAALTLMGIAAWLVSERRRSWFVVLPMALVLAVTTTSLVIQLVASRDTLIRGTCVALLLLTSLLAFDCARATIRLRRAAAA